MEDDILDKKVPVIVFIQNKKLLKDAVKNELEMDKDEREKLKAQAQMNEYLYSVLKDMGVSVKMDEKIGMEFLEMGNMTASFA